MKKHFFYLALCFFNFLVIYAQSGINTKTPKATLDVVANTSNSELASGLIAPRVSLSYLYDNSDLYNLELLGAIVYVYDVSEVDINNSIISTRNILSDGYYYFDGVKWVLFVIPDEVNFPTEPWRVENSGIEATANNENIVQNARVGVGFSSQIDGAAQFEVRSSNKGILIPRMTGAERDVISNPSNSLLIFNTDTSCFNFYKKNKWKSLCGDLGDAAMAVPNCGSALILGDYKVGKVLNSANYFQLSINVVEAGNYSILVNNESSGFFFQKEGSFPNTGIYTLQIPAIGTPSTSGTNVFSIKLNDEIISCSSTVNVSTADIQFSNIVVVSTDQLNKGQSSIGKTIVIKVDVTNPGSFNFQTNGVNGVTYSAENIELGVGNSQTVTLFANGNPPIEAGNFQYLVNGTGNVGNAVNAGVEVIESIAQIISFNCDGITVNDVLRLDTALTVSNYIDIPVTSNSTGTYVVNITSSQNPGFTYEGSGNITSVGNSVVRVYGTGVPTNAGQFSFVVSINGTTCNLDLMVVIPTKKILLVGTTSAYIQGALNNSLNFGPNGTSKIESVNVFSQGNSMSATQLRNAINVDGTEIILVGSGWNPNAECITILSNFVKNKKGFVYWVEAEDDQTYIKSFIDKTFGGNIVLTADEYRIYTAKTSPLVPVSNPYLNGVFGDAHGKYFRSDDHASWLGAVPSSLPSTLNYLVHLPPSIGSGTGANSERYTELYGEGFLMFSDWGFLNHNNGYYGFYSPIRFNIFSFTDYSSNGNTVTNTIPVAAGQVANWVIFGNAMDYIFKYVQQNFNPNGSL